PERRRIHGHRVVVRRHGRIVYIRARVWRVKVVVQLLCARALPASLPSEPLTSPAPAPLLPAQPVSPPPQPPVGGSPQRPLNTAAPTISGIARQGETLTVGAGSWTGSPTASSYEWPRCDAPGANCLPIALATTSSYLCTERD